MPSIADLVLGRILLRNGLVREEDLDECLDLQEKLRTQGVKRSLGDLLQEQGRLGGAELGLILEAQALSEVAEQDVLYGKLAVKNGFAAQDAVREALRRQQEEGYKRRIGELLLAQGGIDERGHRAVLSALERLLARMAAKGETTEARASTRSRATMAEREEPEPGPRPGPEPEQKSPLTATPDKGSRVGDFRIVRQLGRGGTATVYLAEWEGEGRLVALKILREDVRAEDGFVRRLKDREARRVFHHENLVEVFHYGEDRGRHYLVMEYVPGVNLSEVQRVDPLDAVRILKQVARGLAVIHAYGVVHRDIKPSNIRITPDGLVKLMDFGLAKSQEDADYTEAGFVVGTFKYMAPEQFRGGPIDGRTDVFSLGIIAFELFTGRAPFECPDKVAYMEANLHKPIPRITKGSPELPLAGDIERLVERMVEKERERRPAADALVRDLDRLQEAIVSGRSPWIETDASSAFYRPLSERLLKKVFPWRKPKAAPDKDGHG